MQILDDYALIDFNEKHKELVYHWRNSDHVRKYMFNDYLFTLDDHNLWFDVVQNSNDIIVKILLYTEQPIGFVNFTNIDKANNKCFWGFYIGEQRAPKGSGQIMAFLSLNYIFKELCLRKLCSEILDFNIRGIHYHKKLGFVEEGRLKEHISRNDGYVDVILMALFKENWLSRSGELLQEWEGYTDGANYY